MNTLLIFLACHFIGDFGLQSKWLAETKITSWEASFYHAAVYTAVFILFAGISPVGALILLLSHLCIDSPKYGQKITKTKYIFLDQVLHISVLLLVLGLKI